MSRDLKQAGNDLLASGLVALGLAKGGSQRELLDLYLSEVELWNSRVDLVRVRDFGELVLRHALDCLAAAPVLASLAATSWIDVGSGAGLPGIPLAIYLPDRRFTLVERSGKRAAFLRGVVAVLRLSDRVEVLEEDVGRMTHCFPGAVFRAFRPFTPDVVRTLSRIIAAGGFLVAYKGTRNAIDAEIGTLATDFESCTVERLTVPFLAEERHLVLARRRSQPVPDPRTHPQ